LRVLAVFLFAWEPLRIATELPMTLPSLPMRGAPAVVELAAHAFVAAIAVAAAWSLWTDAPHGVALALIAITLSAAVSVQSLYWVTAAAPHHAGRRVPDGDCGNCACRRLSAPRAI